MEGWSMQKLNQRNELHEPVSVERSTIALQHVAYIQNADRG